MADTKNREGGEMNEEKDNKARSDKGSFADADRRWSDGTSDGLSEGDDDGGI